MKQTTRPGAATSRPLSRPKSRTKTPAAVCAALSLGILLAGCAAPQQAGVILSTSQAGYSAVVSTEQGTGNAMAAQLKGSLVLGPGGCFEVLDETGKSNWLVYPAGSTVVDGKVPSLKIGNTSYNVGDTVDLGGGFGALTEAGLNVAGACALAGEPFIVHSGSR